MITFDFVQKIHKLVKGYPEKLMEYQILYPEAFKSENITEKVEFRLYGSGFQTFEMYDGTREIGTFRPFAERGYFYTELPASLVDMKKPALFIQAEVTLIDGYKITWNTSGYHGFRIYRFGGKNVVNLEFKSDSEKNRIKGE